MGPDMPGGRIGLTLAGLLILASPAACAEGEPREVAKAEAAAPGTLCRGKESAYLHAVKAGSDDAVSICVAEGPGMGDASVAVRWRRFGETKEWTCESGGCGNVLAYERYTRPQVTYLRLSFVSGDVTYAIEDDYPGDDPEFDPKAPPTVNVSATWKSKPDDYVFDEEYSLTTGRLGMMKLERYIEMMPMI